MLVVLGVIAVLWVGTAVVMAEVHKNVRPVFIVLSSVITVGLAYAWYSFNHSDTSDNSDVKEREEREEREDAESGTPLLINGQDTQTHRGHGARAIAFHHPPQQVQGQAPYDYQAQQQVEYVRNLENRFERLQKDDHARSQQEVKKINDLEKEVRELKRQVQSQTSHGVTPQQQAGGKGGLQAGGAVPGAGIENAAARAVRSAVGRFVSRDDRSSYADTPPSNVKFEYPQ